MLTQFKNLIILYAPGLGGNHLANLISTSRVFNRNFRADLYSSDSENAHYSDVSNLKKDSLIKNLVKLKTQSNVLCGHLGEYLWIKHNIADRFFSNKKFLIIKFPNKDTVAYQRLLKFAPHLANEYYYQEQLTLYSKQHLVLLFNETDFVEMPAELLFAKDTVELENFLTKELGIQLDQQLVPQLHAKWYDSVLNQIDNYK